MENRHQPDDSDAWVLEIGHGKGGGGGLTYGETCSFSITIENGDLPRNMKYQYSMLFERKSFSR